MSLGGSGVSIGGFRILRVDICMHYSSMRVAGFDRMYGSYAILSAVKSLLVI